MRKSGNKSAGTDEENELSAFSGLSTIEKLKAEIDLLTRCSSDAVYRLRYDTMQYDYISPSATLLLGYEVDELLRMNMRSLILETRLFEGDVRTVESYAGLEENRRKGEVQKWQADYRMKRSDGREIWVADVSYPWFDESGAIIGSVGSLRDITDRTLAETRLRDELLGLSGNDSVTGLLTRPQFWGRLEDELCRLRRTHSDLTLILLEIDNFARIQEIYGREVADTVLAEIAGILHASLREIDLPARLAEREIGILLPETPAEGGMFVAERLRARIANKIFFAGSHTNSVGCTVSIGLASARFGENIDAAALYKLADMRLYLARHSGENRISADETLAGNLH